MEIYINERKIVNVIGAIGHFALFSITLKEGLAYRAMLQAFKPFYTNWIATLFI